MEINQFIEKQKSIEIKINNHPEFYEDLDEPKDALFS